MTKNDSPDGAVLHARTSRYFAIRSFLSAPVFSPDGSELAYIVNTSGQYNIWRQSPLGGWPWQVTTFEDTTVRALLWTSSGDLLGLADRRGDEQYQLFAVPATGGEVAWLTNRTDAQYLFGAHSLAPSGDLLALSTNDRASTDVDILLCDLVRGETRRVLADGGSYAPGCWSPDGERLTVVEERGGGETRLFVVEARDGAATEALAHDAPTSLLPGPWLADGSGFYVLTDWGREYRGLARFTPATRTLEWVFATEGDVEHVVLSRDGRRLLWTVNDGGRHQLYLRDEGRPTVRITGLPSGVVEQMTLAPDGASLALLLGTPTAPPDLYLLLLGAVSAEKAEAPRLRRLTYSMLGGLSPEELIEPEQVVFSADDGQGVMGWLYSPPDASAQAPAPFVLALHGGPQAQERARYAPFFQALVAQGIGVLAPNIRGSTGYGRTYARLAPAEYGGDELQDIAAAAQFLRALPQARADRLGVFGESFGGFEALSALTRLPEYWAAGASFFGPSDLVALLRNAPPPWRRFVARTAALAEDDEAEAERLRRRSPLAHVEQVRAPVLLVQGARDPRVSPSQSEAFAAALRERGREVQYHRFEDEGHGFTHRVNALRAYQLAVRFFVWHLALEPAERET